MSSQRAEQLVEAGVWLRLSGDHAGARKLFEQALKLDPDNARARELLATDPLQQSSKEQPPTAVALAEAAFALPVLPGQAPLPPPGPTAAPAFDPFAPPPRPPTPPPAAAAPPPPPPAAVAAPPPPPPPPAPPSPPEELSAELSFDLQDSWSLALGGAPEPEPPPPPPPASFAPPPPAPVMPDLAPPSPASPPAGVAPPPLDFDAELSFAEPPPPPAAAPPPPLDFDAELSFAEPPPAPPPPAPAAAPPPADDVSMTFEWDSPPEEAPAAAPASASYQFDGELAAPSLRGLSEDAESGWDSASNPGIKIPSFASSGGDAMDLVAKDPLPPSPAARAPAPSDSHAANEVESLLKGAKDLLDLDDHSGAVDLIRKAGQLAPNDPRVRAQLEKSEATLQSMFESKLGRLDAVPTVVLKDDDIIWLNLDHRAGFVLAQIDGAMTFEDLFAVSGMSRLDTARILAQLVDEGVIRGR